MPEAMRTGGGRRTGGEVAEDLVGFTPTRIVLINLFPIMSLFNTLFFPLPLFTTSFVLLQRPKGQGNKGEFGFFSPLGVPLMLFLNCKRFLIFSLLIFWLFGFVLRERNKDSVKLVG